LKKKFFDPSYVRMRFFEAAPGRLRAIKTFFLAGFPFFTSNWIYCRVTGPQNKIFIKNQLTLVYMSAFPCIFGTTAEYTVLHVRVISTTLTDFGIVFFQKAFYVFFITVFLFFSYFFCNKFLLIKMFHRKCFFCKI
jgi:hypothetical protein